MNHHFRFSIIIILCSSTLFQFIIPGSACTVMGGTYGKAFMTIYNKNGNFIEKKDLGSSGWGSDCLLGKDLYQYDQNSFFLLNNGKLTQYKLDLVKHYPSETTNIVNASNNKYFLDQHFTGISSSYVYFVNQTNIIGNWTIVVNILVQNATDSR